MPGFDRTGPVGRGPMTGGGRGLCGPRATKYGANVPGFRGFGWYNRGYTPAVQPDFSQMDLDALKSQTEVLKEELKALESQIEALSSEK